ncbi:LPD5 domain-containing protein [Dysgonomonas termitidis]|uniref:LPD5 domain-containing protein n=1 Tax=Dysgonomonas termitidis TaxID=1516126 RepID=A0ABV9KRW4_9BACT
MQQTATITKNIQDFGQKIGGAKKDLARNAMEQISLITNDALARQPLSKSFPRPDFARMSRDGLITGETAIKLQYLYNNIPAKPRYSYSVRRWVERVIPVIQIIKIGLENEQVLGDQPFVLKEGFTNFRKEMNAANWPHEDYSPYPFRIVHPHQFSSDRCFVVAKGNYIRHKANTIEECIAWIKDNAGTSKKATVFQCSVWRNPQADTYYITPVNKSGIVLKTFATREEAFAFRQEHMDELERIYRELRTIPEERRDWNRPRTGTNYRNGIDKTPEQFSAVFPFRGVEFGNWVTQLERAASLNEAYDALYDLAGILEISPQAITLDNQLALAFGARGSGKALAHYETLKRVINLTKKKGAGSLAHEWFHALDNYLCIKEGQSLLYATENPTTVASLSGVLSQLRTKIKQTDFYSRSKKIDQYKSKPYWATMVELTARAFEKYVITKLAEKGHINDYLANVKTVSEFLRPDVYPYPTDEEIREIAPYYDQLFGQIFGVLKEEIKQTA